MPEDVVTLSYDRESGNLSVDKPTLVVQLSTGQTETIFWAKGYGVTEITGITFAEKPNPWPYANPTTVAGCTSWKVTDADMVTEITTYEYTISAMTAQGAKTIDPRIVEEPIT